MPELVSPSQSESLVAIFACLVTVAFAAAGWREAGKRGLLAGLVGPLAWLLWQGHKYVTRYDARTGYFGLDKVAVLAVEVVLFVALGFGLSVVWEKIRYQRNTGGEQGDAK